MVLRKINTDIYKNIVETMTMYKRQKQTKN